MGVGGGCFFFQAEEGIRGLVRSRGRGDGYKGKMLGYGGGVFYVLKSGDITCLSLIHI